MLNSLEQTLSQKEHSQTRSPVSSRLIRVFLFAVLLTILSILGTSSAQNCTGKNDFGIWFGGQFANGYALGSVVNGRMYLLEGRYSRRFFTNRLVSLRYVVEVTPLSVLGDPQTYDQRAYAYGSGGSPAGVQMNLVRYRRFQPFLTSGGGFLYFNRQVFGATRFNFTAELGVGVQLFSLRRRPALSVVYKYHHISNANLASYNPGMDSHMLFVGVSVIR